MKKAVMTKEIAQEIIPDGSEWDVEGKTYWVSTSENYTLDGRFSYFKALEIGKEYEDEESLYDEDGVYVAFPIIEKDSDYYNPDPNEWCDIYDERNPEVWYHMPR